MQDLDTDSCAAIARDLEKEQGRVSLDWKQGARPVILCCVHFQELEIRHRLHLRRHLLIVRLEIVAVLAPRREEHNDDIVWALKHHLVERSANHSLDGILGVLVLGLRQRQQMRLQATCKVSLQVLRVQEQM